MQKQIIITIFCLLTFVNSIFFINYKLPNKSQISHLGNNSKSIFEEVSNTQKQESEPVIDILSEEDTEEADSSTQSQQSNTSSNSTFIANNQSTPQTPITDTSPQPPADQPPADQPPQENPPDNPPEDPEPPAPDPVDSGDDVGEADPIVDLDLRGGIRN